MVRDHVDRLRKDLPLRLLHDTALKNLRRIAFFHFNRFLQDDRTGIHSLIHKMHRRTGDLYASRKRSLVDLQSVKADTAEGRDQGRMDIDDLISVFSIMAAGIFTRYPASTIRSRW